MSRKEDEFFLSEMKKKKKKRRSIVSVSCFFDPLVLFGEPNRELFFPPANAHALCSTFSLYLSISLSPSHSSLQISRHVRENPNSVP